MATTNTRAGNREIRRLMMMMELVLALLVVSVTGNNTRASGGEGEDNFELTILHVNDFHARFEETNVYSGRCTPENKEKNRCFGGVARLKTVVDNERSRSPNVVYLSGGDYFQGTIWYTVHKWRVVAHFLDLVPHDAMAFGNHEFDDGINGKDGVVNFLKAIKFPVLAANLDIRDEPSMNGLYAKSVVLERSGRKIGVVGYLTTETLTISNPGRVKITDEVAAVRAEARRLKRQGVDIIIALGHAGFSKDTNIARDVAEVDVVVGGHTNTFLYTGENPSTEVSVAAYPAVVQQSSGRKVPVVQAYAFGKYMGRLVLTFDRHGEVTAWNGNPILLDSTIEKDEGVLQEVVTWKAELQAQIRDQIARTYVFLDGNRLSCRARECNLGNLMTDSVVHANAKYPDDLRWAYTSLAVMNSGGIRASIDERASNGTITMEDLLTVAPFQNTIDIVELKGRHVKEMFEHSVYYYDPKGIDLKGNFLQVSGFVVVYDINLAPGSRVVRLQARCQECRIPEMQDLDEDQVYRIAMPAFLAMGGDGYSVIHYNKINHHLTGMLDTDSYVEYIKQITPIYQGTENRILFIDSKNLCSGEVLLPFASTGYSTSSTSESSEEEEEEDDDDEEEEEEKAEDDTDKKGGGGNGSGRIVPSSVAIAVVMGAVVRWSLLQW